jgi:transcription antitermination factor NusG
MPLLPREPYVFPDDLLALTERDQAEAKWWVLHTRPRSEKSLVRRLLPDGVPFFLPLYERRWRSRGRLMASQLPLFPGYIFIHADSGGRLRALETNLVVNCIPVADQARLRADLNRVFRLMTSDAPLGPEARLPPGAPVAIVRGPLAGLEGKVIRRGGRLTFFVEVEMLRQGVSVELESWMIEPTGARELAPAH